MVDESKIIGDLIVWGIGYLVIQVVIFVIFVYRMNVKLEIMRAENELIRDENAKRNQAIDASILELRTDLEDHRLAYENRIAKACEVVELRAANTAKDVEDRVKKTAEDLAKKQDMFQKTNDSAHIKLMDSIDFIKQSVGKIAESVSYMSGVLDQHIGNDKATTPPSRRKKNG